MHSSSNISQKSFIKRISRSMLNFLLPCPVSIFDSKCFLFVPLFYVIRPWFIPDLSHQVNSAKDAGHQPDFTLWTGNAIFFSLSIHLLTLLREKLLSGFSQENHTRCRSKVSKKTTIISRSLEAPAKTSNPFSPSSNTKCLFSNPYTSQQQQQQRWLLHPSPKQCNSQTPTTPASPPPNPSPSAGLAMAPP